MHISIEYINVYIYIYNSWNKKISFNFVQEYFVQKFNSKSHILINKDIKKKSQHLYF
jgi:hypothetical protein